MFALPVKSQLALFLLDGERSSLTLLLLYSYFFVKSEVYIHKKCLFEKRVYPGNNSLFKVNTRKSGAECQKGPMLTI